MKLLFDQNLSYTLVRLLSDIFSNAAHIQDFNLDRADDNVVWDFAVRNEFVSVSKDSDFRQRSFLQGAPPKIIWLNVGNCPTKQVESLLRQFASTIDEFAEDLNASFLELR